jgi:hypothetical protein
VRVQKISEHGVPFNPRSDVYELIPSRTFYGEFLTYPLGEPGLLVATKVSRVSITFSKSITDFLKATRAESSRARHRLRKRDRQ